MFPPSTGPIEVTLARPVDDIPRQRRTPEGQPQLAYELKIDGWRLVLSKTPAGAVELWSRHGCNLTTAFPELAAAALEHLAPGTVVDGEVCVLRHGQLDWDRLQRRLGSRALVADEARRAPASYVAFDVLADAGDDRRSMPWSSRRSRLEELASANWRLPLQLVPCTLDENEARAWFTDYRQAGIEGLVVKARHESYLPGQRRWLKVKSRETTEVIVGAVTGHVDRPTTVVAGRYAPSGALVIVGRTTMLRRSQAVQLSRILTPVPSDQHPWPSRISGQFGGPPVDLVHVNPTCVAEVAVDRALQGKRWRHPIRLLRLRLDLQAAEVPPTADAK